MGTLRAQWGTGDRWPVELRPPSRSTGSWLVVRCVHYIFWTHPTHPLFYFYFSQTDLVRYRASRRRTTGMVVPILEAPTHTVSE
jgi:hypothetical protein